MEKKTSLKLFIDIFVNKAIWGIIGIMLIILLFLKFLAPYKDQAWAITILLIALFLLILYVIISIGFMIWASLKTLLTTKNPYLFVFGYIFGILGIIVLLSFAYSSVEAGNKGYLTYGICNDNFNSSMMNADQNRSTNHFYFATVTFFSLGYGDICPMGLSKTVALFNVFIGHFFTVIILAVALWNYLKPNKTKKKGAKK